MWEKVGDENLAKEADAQKVKELETADRECSKKK